MAARRTDAAGSAEITLAVDVCVLTASDGALRVVLARRTHEPYSGRWALPGGFVGVAETPEQAAVRALGAKTGLRRLYLEQLYTFGDPDRDPRGRVVSVAHIALVHPGRLASVSPGGEDVRLAPLQVPWPGEAGGAVHALDPSGGRLRIAFDHAEILGLAVKRLRGKLDYTRVGYELLPSTFTLRMLQDVHETVLGRALNKDSFRRRMLASGDLVATGERETGVQNRPAELFRLAPRPAV